MLFKKEDQAVGLKWRLIGLAGKLLIDFLFVFSSIDSRGYQAVARIRRVCFLQGLQRSPVALAIDLVLVGIALQDCPIARRRMDRRSVGEIR